MQELLSQPLFIKKGNTPLIFDCFSEVSNSSHLIRTGSCPACFDGPWNELLFSPQVNLEDGNRFDKTKNCHALFCKIFEKEIENSICLYTDGSKIPNAEFAGFAIVSMDGSINSRHRASGLTSIFSLEAMAILVALEISEQLELKRVSVFSDAKSVLMAIQNTSFTGNPFHLICDIRLKAQKLVSTGVVLNLIWIPGHCGIQGNEAADVAAREAATYGIDTQLSQGPESEMEGDLVLLLLKVVQRTRESEGRVVY